MEGTRCEASWLPYDLQGEGPGGEGEKGSERKNPNEVWACEGEKPMAKWESPSVSEGEKRREREKEEKKGKGQTPSRRGEKREKEEKSEITGNEGGCKSVGTRIRGWRLETIIWWIIRLQVISPITGDLVQGQGGGWWSNW